LVRRLNRGLKGRLTLVCAPAGFGKTTLVSSWVSACGLPAVWLSLDESDRDVTTFLLYVVEALQTVSEVLGASAAVLLQATAPPPVDEVLAHLVNSLAGFPQRLVLVLDDYHLAASEAVNAAVASLLDHLPATVHLVIASREEPAVPLARLRAGGELNELRQDDLRFGHSEAAEFFASALGRPLPEPQVTALEGRTEGWIAGLQLAALSLEGRDAGRLVEAFTGTNRFVQDYLFEEVLGR
jgi:LuxR family maltose regulon positive regulatory protein